MPPVISASLVAITPPRLESMPSRPCYGIIAPFGPESNHMESAVDRDVRARDVTRFFGGEVHHEANDLRLLSRQRQGNLLDVGSQDHRPHRVPRLRRSELHQDRKSTRLNSS